MSSGDIKMPLIAWYNKLKAAAEELGHLANAETDDRYATYVNWIRDYGALKEEIRAGITLYPHLAPFAAKELKPMTEILDEIVRGMIAEAKKEV